MTSNDINLWQALMRPGKPQKTVACIVSTIYVGVAMSGCFIAEAAANELHPAPLGAPTTFAGSSVNGTIGASLASGTISSLGGGGHYYLYEMPNAMGDVPVEQYRGVPLWWGQAGEGGPLRADNDALSRVSSWEWRVPPGPWLPLPKS
jgi:hypothetical protein